MLNRLPLVTLYLSERCNSRCITCDYWQHGVRDMSLDDVQTMLPDLEALQTRSILISGGEPLLNPQWREISQTLVDRGFQLWLLSSGLSLAKHAAAAAGLFQSVTVSLDGACAKTYARIRGVNAYDKVCEGIGAIAAAGVPTGIRVTLQKANFRELPAFVELAKRLGAEQVSFLAVDINNAHAFARLGNPAADLALNAGEVAELDSLISALEVATPESFSSGLIAESPARLRHIRDYFSALIGMGNFPPVRCNAPEFSAVISAEGLVSPCFFIAGPASVPRAPQLQEALQSVEMHDLRRAIRSGERPECSRCVCSMWREPAAIANSGLRLGGRNRA